MNDGRGGKGKDSGECMRERVIVSGCEIIWVLGTLRNGGGSG